MVTKTPKVVTVREACSIKTDQKLNGEYFWIIYIEKDVLEIQKWKSIDYLKDGDGRGFFSSKNYQKINEEYFCPIYLENNNSKTQKWEAQNSPKYRYGRGVIWSKLTKNCCRVLSTNVYWELRPQNDEFK